MLENEVTHIGQNSIHPSPLKQGSNNIGMLKYSMSEKRASKCLHFKWLIFSYHLWTLQLFCGGFFLSVYIMLPNSWTTVLTSFWQIKYNPFMWPNLSQLSEFIPGALEINFRIGTSCLVHNTCIYFIEIESALHESKFKRNFPAVFINFKAGGQWKMFSFLNFECPKCFLVNNPLSFDYLELIYIFFLQNERQLLIMILFLRSSHQLATLKMLPTSYLEKVSGIYQTIRQNCSESLLFHLVFQ